MYPLHSSAPIYLFICLSMSVDGRSIEAMSITDYDYEVIPLSNKTIEFN